MKSYRAFIVTVLVIFAVMLSNRAIYSFDFKKTGEVDMDATTYDEEKGERIVERMRFRIAEDRKLEHAGSFVQPEGLDKYFGRKMDKLSATLEGMLNRLAEIESRLQTLESSTEQLSKQVDAIKGHLQRQEDKQGEGEQGRQEAEENE